MKQTLLSRVIRLWVPLLSAMVFTTVHAVENFGNHAPGVLGYYIPVFEANPLEMGEKIPLISDLVIGVDGRVQSFAEIYSPDASFENPLMLALGMTLFRPGHTNGEPVLGFMRQILNDFMVFKPSLGGTPPRPRWVVGPDLVEVLGSYPGFYHPEAGYAVIELTIDKDGDVIWAKGTDDYTDAVAKDLFISQPEMFPFFPAKKGGEPIDCKVVLYLRRSWEPWDYKGFPRLNLRPALKSPAVEDTIVSVIVGYGAKGVPYSGRIHASGGEEADLAVIDAVRRLVLVQEQKREGMDLVQYELQFKFPAGKTEAQLMSDPTLVVRSLPEPTASETPEAVGSQ